MWTPVCMEPPLGYHPCGAGFLTRGREPVWGQCQVGSLTGSGRLEVSERPRFPRNGWKPFEECKGEGA